MRKTAYWLDVDAFSSCVRPKVVIKDLDQIALMCRFPKPSHKNRFLSFTLLKYSMALDLNIARL